MSKADTNIKAPIKIDIRAVVSERLGRASRFVPSFIISKL